MSIIDQRKEFVQLASSEGSNIRELCRRFGISPTTAYKWLGRSSCEDRSRRPLFSPSRTSDEVESLIVSVRKQHPTWGGRKLVSHLSREGCAGLPNPSTATSILRRHGLLNADLTGSRGFVRFESEAPNLMWQMDFKGWFPLQTGQKCHPLILLDDCTRYSICARACLDQSSRTVWEALRSAFRICGLPLAILCDNGSCWGSTAEHRLTPLAVKLMLYGVEVIHGRPYHPQTQGKLERWHRTLKADLLAGRTFADLASCQSALDAFRLVYNSKRPHESLDMKVPADLYAASKRAFPETEPQPFFDEGTAVRKVGSPGIVSFKGRRFSVPDALLGYPVGIRESEIDGVYDLVFCGRMVSQIDLRYHTNQAN